MLFLLILQNFEHASHVTMSVVKLLSRIEELQESYLLEELLNIIDLETNRSKTFKIPEAHKKSLDLSLQQMEIGETLPHNEVINELKNGLSD